MFQVARHWGLQIEGLQILARNEPLQRLHDEDAPPHEGRPEVEGAEKENGDADGSGGTPDDSDEDLVAMMIRATCQDVKVRQKRTTEGRTEKPSLRAGQRARVIFLRDDAEVGVQRVYTDAEVQSFLSTGPFSVASESGIDISADGFYRGVRTQAVAPIDVEPDAPADDLHTRGGNCNAEDDKHAETDEDDDYPASVADDGAKAEGAGASGEANRASVGGVVSEVGRDPTQTTPRSYASVVCDAERTYERASPGLVRGAGAIASVPPYMGSGGLHGGCLGLSPTELKSMDKDCLLSSVVRPGSECVRGVEEGSDAPAVGQSTSPTRDKNAASLLVADVDATVTDDSGCVARVDEHMHVCLNVIHDYGLGL